SSSRPSTSSGPAPSSPRKGQRTSIFSAASDALGLRLGLARRRPPAKEVPAAVVLPDVIEITARNRDEEEEERNRLRAEAAQALGISLDSQDVQSHHHIDTEEDDEEGAEEMSLSTRHLTESAHSAHFQNGPRSPGLYAPHITHPYGSSTSVAATSPPPPMPVGRYRSGSLMGSGGHSRSNSVNLTPVPTYPATVSSLAQWQQRAGMIPKYYPPSSLRIFALSNSKNWKARYITLTSPTAIITRTKTPAVSYLHLFKGSGAEEKELERLVINEDSVVFVSDDEVGGRRHVIKVGGIEGGAFKKELNVEESGRTMWFLQIEDQAESQQWITGIKNSILNQRAIRAGLLPAAGTNFGVNEPRGDIDVMLSMRAQGFITSHSNARQQHGTPPSAVSATPHPEQNFTYAPSISEHSLRSQASSPKTVGIAVTTLRGLFSGSRPRSGSRATSVDTTKLSSQHHQQQQHEVTIESGGGGMGSNLMSILRSATPDLQSQSSGATAVASNSTLPPATGRASSSPFVPSAAPELGIDRQIISLENGQQQGQMPPSLHFASDDRSASSPPGSPTLPGSTRAVKALSLGSMSLQPPPRGKRWTSVAAVTPPVVTVNASATDSTPTPTDMYKNAHFNGTTGSLGALTYTRYNKEASLPSEPASPTTGSMMTDHNQPYHNSNHANNLGLRPPSHEYETDEFKSRAKEMVSSRFIIFTSKNDASRWTST
ncbi:hypothetical protein AN958_07648, partial [Leucoagaricus sp. SymC.cos]